MAPRPTTLSPAHDALPLEAWRVWPVNSDNGRIGVGSKEPCRRRKDSLGLDNEKGTNTEQESMPEEIGLD